MKKPTKEKQQISQVLDKGNIQEEKLFQIHRTSTIFCDFCQPHMTSTAINGLNYKHPVMKATKTPLNISLSWSD